MRRLPLGQSTATGDKALRQCYAVIAELRDALGRVDGVSLVQVTDAETRTARVEAVILTDSPLARAWVGEAERLAPSVWEVVSVKSTRQLVRG